MAWDSFFGEEVQGTGGIDEMKESPMHFEGCIFKKCCKKYKKNGKHCKKCPKK